MIPDAALDQHVAIIGRTGSGKTYATKGCVERLLTAGRHVVVIDPTGAWWGLRSSADGTSPGFPVVVFGGERADVPISDGAGADLAAAIIERRISCVVDVSEFTMAGRRRFLAALFQRIYERTRTPLHLVIDEADECAPQRPMPDQTTLLHRLDQIVRRGRSRGLRTIMITQRPAVLHKDVLSQAGTLVAMKLTAPQDRNAVGAWIEGQADRDAGRELLATLPRLARGEGWIWWPEGSVLARETFPAIATFDSSRTPDHADDAAVAPVLADVDLAGLREMFAGKPADAGEGAQDAERRGYEAGLAEGRRQGRMETAEELRILRTAVHAALGYLAPHAREEGGGRIIDVRRPPEPPTIDMPAAVPARVGRAVQEQREHAGDAGPSTYAAAMLRVLLARWPASQPEAAWAVLAGRSRSSSSWSAAISELRRHGLIDRDGNRWRPSATALERADARTAKPTTPAALLDLWLSRLNKSEAAMLRAIAQGPATRQQLSDRTGYSLTSSSFSAALSALRHYELIEAAGATYQLAAALREIG